jgi:hypothetical protein
MTGGEFWSFVYGPNFDTAAYCAFCKIPKATDAIPSMTVTISEDISYVTPDGAPTTKFGCGPVISGLTVPKDQVGDVTINLKATLLAYSEDDAGNVNNEYATFPFSVVFQAPP